MSQTAVADTAVPWRAAAIAIGGALLSLVLMSKGVGVSRGGLVLFLAVYGFIGIVYWSMYWANRSIDVLAPAPIFLLVVGLYATSSGIAVDAIGATYVGDFISPWTQTLFYVSCLVGEIGFIAGCLIGQRFYLIAGPDEAESWRTSDRTFVTVCLVGGGALSIMLMSEILPLFNFLNVPSYNEWAFATRLDRQADVAAGIRDFLFRYMPVNLLLAGCVAVALGSRQSGLKVVAFCVLLAFLITNTLAGARGVVVAAGIPFVIYWHYRLRPLKAVELGVGLLIGYAFITLLAIARYFSDPRQMIELIVETLQDSGVEKIGIGSATELWTATNLHRLIEGIGNGETHYSYGVSVISELLTIVPRAVMPGRPLSLGEQFVDVFYPGLLESGGGMGFFILQEGYWAFGLVGVFMSMAIFGFSIERIYQAYLRYRTSIAATLLYSFAYAPLVLGSVRSGMIGSYKAAALTVVPLILAVLGSRLIGHRGQRIRAGQSR